MNLKSKQSELRIGFNRGSRHKTQELEGRGLLPFLPPLRLPRLRLQTKLLCFVHNAVLQVKPLGSSNCNVDMNSCRTAFTNILGVKMPRICGISRTFDDLLALLRSKHYSNSKNGDLEPNTHKNLKPLLL